MLPLTIGEHMAEVALIDANVCWTPTPRLDGSDTHPARYPELCGEVTVEHRKEPEATSTYHKHRVKLGACIMWKNWTAEERVIELFRYVQLMTVRDGLQPDRVHRELMRVPEYREMFVGSVDDVEGASADRP
jgi:hypothetical protein